MSGLEWEGLWWRYAELGGTAEAAVLAQELLGGADIDAREQNYIAHALNERLAERGYDFPVAFLRPRPAPHRAMRG